MWLRERAGIKEGDDTGMDLADLKLQGHVETQRLRATVQQYEEEILYLEKDRERLNKKLRVKALERGQRAAQLGVSVEKLTALEEIDAELDKVQLLPCSYSLLTTYYLLLTSCRTRRPFPLHYEGQGSGQWPLPSTMKGKAVGSGH